METLKRGPVVVVEGDPRLAPGGGAGAVAAAGVCAPNSRQHVPVGLAEVGLEGGLGEMPELVQGAETDALDDRELVRQALSRLPVRRPRGLVVALLRGPHRGRDRQQAWLCSGDGEEFGGEGAAGRFATRSLSTPGGA